MQSKKCFKCGAEKPLEEFYRHPIMADGRVNKCKLCNKFDVTANRVKNIEHYRLYDRSRGGRWSPGYSRAWREKNPQKYKAQSMVNNSIRDKKLSRQPCEVCGTDKSIHGHHDDYLKPLDVRWLCAVHHSQWHKENGEGLNGSVNAKT